MVVCVSVLWNVVVVSTCFTSASVLTVLYSLVAFLLFLSVGLSPHCDPICQTVPHAADITLFPRTNQLDTPDQFLVNLRMHYMWLANYAIDVSMVHYV